MLDPEELYLKKKGIPVTATIIEKGGLATVTMSVGDISYTLPVHKWIERAFYGSLGKRLGVMDRVRIRMLAERKAWTAKRLAVQFGVSERTIFRILAEAREDSK